MAMEQQFLASPTYYPTGSINQHGLTKREWFAAMALQGLLAGRISGATEAGYEQISVQMADKLIEELNK